MSIEEKMLLDEIRRSNERNRQLQEEMRLMKTEMDQQQSQNDELRKISNQQQERMRDLEENLKREQSKQEQEWQSFIKYRSFLDIQPFQSPNKKDETLRDETISYYSKTSTDFKIPPLDPYLILPFQENNEYMENSLPKVDILPHHPIQIGNVSLTSSPDKDKNYLNDKINSYQEERTNQEKNSNMLTTFNQLHKKLIQIFPNETFNEGDLASFYKLCEMLFEKYQTTWHQNYDNESQLKQQTQEINNLKLILDKKEKESKDRFEQFQKAEEKFIDHASQLECEFLRKEEKYHQQQHILEMKLEERNRQLNELLLKYEQLENGQHVTRQVLKDQEKWEQGLKKEKEELWVELEKEKERCKQLEIAMKLSEITFKKTLKELKENKLLDAEEELDEFLSDEQLKGSQPAICYTMKAKIFEYREKYLKMKKLYSDLKKDIENLKQDQEDELKTKVESQIYDQLKKKHSSLEERHKSLLKDFEHLQQSFEKSTTEKQESNKELLQLQITNGELKDSIKSMKMDLARKDQMLKQLTIKFNQLELEWKELRMVRSNAELKVKALTGNMNVKESLIKDLKKKQDQLMDQIHSLTEQLQQQEDIFDKEQYKQLQNESHSKSQRLANLNQRVKSLQQENKSLLEQLEEEQEQLQSQIEINKRLENRLNMLKHEKQELINLLDQQLQPEVESFKFSSHKLENQIAQSILNVNYTDLLK